MTRIDDYLKTQAVASALGLSVSTIKRWVDSGTILAVRTQGKHRLIPRAEAIRMAHELKRDPREILKLPSLPSGEFLADDDRVCDRLFEFLKEGHTEQARQLIKSEYALGCGAVRLADHVIRPVMNRIGHDWMVGGLDVYQEHQASQVVASALTDLIGQVGRVVVSAAPLAIGATTEGDPYLISTLLAELLLLEAGWSVRNLGVNLPSSSLARATVRYAPKLVYLSVNFLRDPDRFIREYMSFYETASRMGSAVIIGGRALVPEIRSRLIYSAFGDRMVHLAEFARQLTSPARGAGPVPASSTTGGISIREPSRIAGEHPSHPETRSGERIQDE